MTSPEQHPRRTSSQALTMTRRYAPDPGRQVLALLRLLAAGDGNSHNHTDVTQAEQFAKVSRLDLEESLDDVEDKETSCGKIG
jgi:hypothetical protein